MTGMSSPVSPSPVTSILNFDTSSYSFDSSQRYPPETSIDSSASIHDKSSSEPLRVSEHQGLDDLLVLFMKTGRRIALVEDRWGGTAGIITRGDILELIVKPVIDDEEDDAPGYELIGSEPYDDHSGYPDRNIYPVAYGSALEPLGALINPNTDARLNFKVTEPFEYTPDMEITRQPLPAGDYAMRFVITDIFGNRINSEFVVCEWDGSDVTYLK